MQNQRSHPINELADQDQPEFVFPHSGTNYWTLLKELPSAVYVCDREGRICFYNKAAVKLWGREPKIGKDLWCGSWKIYKTDGSPLPFEQCPMAITLKEGRAVKDTEIMIERPDGTRLNIQPHPQPLFDEQGNLSGAFNLLVDITEKNAQQRALMESEQRYRDLSLSLEKKVEERTMALKKTEERYSKMVEEVEDYAILLLDTDGNILNWNRGAEKIKGYSEEEILGRNFRLFYRSIDRKRKLPEQLITRAIKEGKANHEGWRVRKDGSKFWGSIVITALHDAENNVIGFSKVTRDLTERRLAEEQMKNYARDIEFSNKQLREYAYVASHDLQEPLRKIQIFIELLENNLDNPSAAKRYLRKIHSSAKRMTSLVRGVLQYSQLSRSGELFTSVDLNHVLLNVLDDFDLLIEETQASVTYEKLPVLLGIPTQLHQLFANLISNAIKFSPKKPVLHISSKKASSEELRNLPQLSHRGEFIKLIFHDEGIGFKQEYADQVFRLFKRLDVNTTGTGIGLALCKKIIENHKGYITVDSQHNIGSTFTIFLPTT